MTVTIARYLKDFGEPKPIPVLVDHFGELDLDQEMDVPAIIEEPPVDLEAERAQAYSSGFETASDEMQRLRAEEREQMQAAHAQEIAALRQVYEAEAAALIETRLRDIAAQTAQAVSDQVARILSPLLDDALVTKAVSDLADGIRAAMIEGDVGTLTVRGPIHLFEKLKAGFGDEAPLLRHMEAADLDITVDIGQSVMVTRMSAWSASLRKVLA